MDKLRKALLKDEALNLQLVAPDGPFDHPEDRSLRQWWDRHDSTYQGLEISMQILQDLWDSEGSIVGIIGFSQGARFAHLIALLNQFARSQGHAKVPFKGLQSVIQVAGYDRPLPENWSSTLEACGCRMEDHSSSINIDIPSLHIWGLTDPLIPPSESQSVMASYQNPKAHEHEGGHHVPMKTPNIRAYLDFLKQAYPAPNHYSSTENSEVWEHTRSGAAAVEAKPAPSTAPKPFEKLPEPDEETSQAQQDEVEALTAIYPDEVTVVSKISLNEVTGEKIYQHPISYRIDLKMEEGTSPGTGHWPKHLISLGVTYPHNYPTEEALPQFKLVHENNVMEFPSAKVAACMRAVDEAANAELGMPCVLSCF